MYLDFLLAEFIHKLREIQIINKSNNLTLTDKTLKLKLNNEFCNNLKAVICLIL